MVSGFDSRGGFVCGAVALAAALVALSGAQPARAQGIGMMPNQMMEGAPPNFSGEALQQSLKGTKRAPPAALPGASNQQAIAPPSTVPATMSPNDELFDAINRNDIAAVRDALSRGAQIDAKDELGMTPLQLSVDLGRNSITFLLLSMRDAGAAAPVQKVAAKPVAHPPKPPSVRKARARPARQIEAAERQTLPRKFADDGGVPVPQAGFLGFGGH